MFLGSVLIDADQGPADVIEGFEGYALAEVRVGQVREFGIGIVRDPDPPDAKPLPCNVAHCLLKVPTLSKRQNHRLRQALARASTLRL